MKVRMILSCFTIMALFAGCGGSSSSSKVNVSQDDNQTVDDTPVKKTSVRFLSFYTPENESEKKGLKILTFSDTALSVQTVNDDIYPPQMYGGAYDLTGNTAAYGNVYSMVLHKDLGTTSEYRGVFGYLDSNQYEYLPLIDVSQDSDYKYIEPGTLHVTPSNHIIYISATNDKVYGDEYKPNYVRYNPTNKVFDIAIPCKSFILEQPEKGDDTEACLIGRNFSTSPDGRYIYGHMDGFGTEGGGLHWDYKILFQYDFKDKIYTRLGEKDDAHVRFIGATSDAKHIVYTSNSQTKVLNLNTGSVNILQNTPHVREALPYRWNLNGMVKSTTVALYYVDVINDKETTILEKRVDNVQFSENGQSVYFRLHGDKERMLYKTQNLNQNSPYKAVGQVPSEYGDIMLLSTSNTTTTHTTKPPVSNSSKSCIEDEGDDGSIYWSTCWDLFPESDCSASGLGSQADTDYTQNYRVINGSCIDDPSFTVDDAWYDGEYQGENYKRYLIFPE